MDRIFEQMMSNFFNAMAGESNRRVYVYTMGGFPPDNKDTLGQRLAEQERSLEMAIKREDYEQAAIIRDRIKNLKENFDGFTSKVDELNQQKEQAVKEQNYERAAELKKEIEALQNQF